MQTKQPVDSGQFGPLNKAQNRDKLIIRVFTSYVYCQAFPMRCKDVIFDVILLFWNYSACIFVATSLSCSLAFFKFHYYKIAH